MSKSCLETYDYWTSFLTASVLSVLVLSYAVFGKVFAEIFVQSPWGFPVFIGEIIILFGVLLSGWRFFFTSFFSRQAKGMILLYTCWILFKAARGYLGGGPLSFRHAALFYYPLTAVLMVTALDGLRYERRTQYPRIPNDGAMTGLVVFLGISMAFFRTEQFAGYVLLAMAAGLSLRVQSLALRKGVLLALLAAAIFSGQLSCSSRSNILGIGSALLFLAIFTWRTARVRAGFTLFAVTGLIALTLAVFALSSDRTSFRSMVSFRDIRDSYVRDELVIRQERAKFTPLLVPVKIYNNDLQWQVTELESTMAEQDRQREREVRPLTSTEQEKTHVSQPSSAVVPLSPAEAIPAVPSSRKLFVPVVEERTYGTAIVNILFRWYIWRDMVEEIIRGRAWFGMNFGYPQRSRSLEMLRWAEVEWHRDGWIAPHNSWLHVIYRAGVVGLALIIGFWWLLGALVRKVFAVRSWTGACLLSVLVFGAVSANTLVFLEVPYTAIPFWVVCGIAVFYIHNLEEARP